MLLQAEQVVRQAAVGKAHSHDTSGAIPFSYLGSCPGGEGVASTCAHGTGRCYTARSAIDGNEQHLASQAFLWTLEAFSGVQNPIVLHQVGSATCIWCI